MFVTREAGELDLNIVYYGAPLSGKTTNLQYIHANVDSASRVELMSIEPFGDRILFFTLLRPHLGWLKGLKPRFVLCIVAGEVTHEASLGLVLERAHGVVFVADSQAERLRDNVAFLASLTGQLAKLGRDLSEHPFVLQCNKQDLPNVLTPEVLRERLGQDDVPYLGSVARERRGTLSTLRTIIGLVVRKMWQEATSGP